MRKGFEVNGDYRLMDSSELVYILTNSAVMVNKVQEKEVVYGSFTNAATQTRTKDRLSDRVQTFMTICSLFWEITRPKNVGLS